MFDFMLLIRSIFFMCLCVYVFMCLCVYVLMCFLPHLYKSLLVLFKIASLWCESVIGREDY